MAVRKRRTPPKASSDTLEGRGLATESANGATGLLIVDMISCWDFPDADKLLPVATALSKRISALKRRCRRAGVPVIYANDNRGRWRSDFGALIELSVACGGAGAAITSELMPDHDDYFVLKPQQSSFVATPARAAFSGPGRSAPFGDRRRQ